jgi:hypothetical protein
MKFKGLQWASQIIGMDNSRMLKNVVNGIFNGRRPMERLRLRWEENMGRHSSLLLKIRERVRPEGDMDILRQTAEETRAR